jgi:hypothetical protein
MTWALHGERLYCGCRFARWRGLACPWAWFLARFAVAFDRTGGLHLAALPGRCHPGDGLNVMWPFAALVRGAEPAGSPSAAGIATLPDS